MSLRSFANTFFYSVGFLFILFIVSFASQRAFLIDLYLVKNICLHVVKNPFAVQEIQFNSWLGQIYWRRIRLPTPVFLGFPGGLAGKESACNAGDLGLIPELGRSPGEGQG